MKIILRVVLFIVVFIVGIRYMEKKSIFYPMKQITSNPSIIGLDYRDIYFDTSDGKTIHAWFIPEENARFTVLFSHGNAGNIGHRMDKVAMMHDIGLNVFIYDYRGYGKSKGSPSEKGIYEDAYAAYEYLVYKLNVPNNSIILYGESIGGAVSIELALNRHVSGLITENTFTSVKDMVRLAFPIIPYFIFSSRFDSVSKIQNVKCDKLLIHSFDDEIVPFAQGEKLFRAASEPKRFLRIRGGHNTAFWDSMKDYRQGIRDFVESL
jgi:uncharacterized protein